jgi:hypothetical protein
MLIRCTIPSFGRAATALGGLLSLAILTLCAVPAKAAVVVGVGVPAPVWVYYPPPPPYVVYPPYLYPGTFFIGTTFGPNHYRHWHHWRHW